MSSEVEKWGPERCPLNMLVSLTVLVMITVSWPSTQAKFQEHLSLYIILKITWNIFEEENKKPL